MFELSALLVISFTDLELFFFLFLLGTNRTHVNIGIYKIIQGMFDV